MTSRSQTKIAINTSPAVPTVSHDITNIHAVVSGIRNDVANTPAVASDSHRNALGKSPGDALDQNRLASAVRTIPVVE